MKIFESIFDNHIRKIVEITVNQVEFVQNCGTTDAARLLMEKHREKHRPLYIAFLHLKKAFDRVPHELVAQQDSRHSKFISNVADTMDRWHAELFTPLELATGVES